MISLIDGAGVFIWPLGVCSFMAVFIVVERLIALAPSRIIPKHMINSFLAGKIPEGKDNSVGGRIVQYHLQNHPDPEQLKAFARLEINSMERGLFILEIVVSAAPLLGLLGTVTGLVKVFANVSPESGMPDPGAFIEGIALALTTTMLGLSIAIPALVGNHYLIRRVDTLAARLNVGVERLIDIAAKGQTKSGGKA
jgi:biopolymer transport protein ExbB